MARPVTPLAGFNVHGTPVAGRPVGTCCNCFSQDTYRTKLGTFYCRPCFESAKAYAAKVRGEGHEAVLAAVVP